MGCNEGSEQRHVLGKEAVKNDGNRKYFREYGRLREERMEEGEGKAAGRPENLHPYMSER